jgi:hypothetical protein
MTGNTFWSNLYGASADAVEVAAEITNDGQDGFVFTGTAQSSFTINEDYYLVNLDRDGKSGSCEKEFTRDFKSHWPCLNANFQAVNINDIRFACTQYEKVDYVARKCSGSLIGQQTQPKSVPADVISISPNPTSTSVKVLFQDVAITSEGGTLTIFNRNGKIVYSDIVTSDEVRVPVEGLPNDIYMVRFVGKDGKQYQTRFIKK